MTAPERDVAPESSPSILPPSAHGFLQAARILASGGVVALPTDTLYGLAAAVFEEAAVERVAGMKGRATDHAVPVLLATAADLPILVREVSRLDWKLIERFWPGALTLVLPARSSISPRITGRGDTVAVRVPASRSCLTVLQVLGQPVLGTSANRGGATPTLTADAVLAQLGTEIDAVLKDDQSIRAATASTVAEVREARIIVHRRGAVSNDALRDATGVRVVDAPDDRSSARRGRA